MSNPALGPETTSDGAGPAGPTTVPPPSLWSVTGHSSRDTMPGNVVETLCSIYQRTPYAGCVPNNVAAAVWAEAVSQLLARGAVMYVATNPANPDHWLGYALTERTGDGVPVVHFAFVKPTYRRGGVFRSLLAAAGIERRQRLFYTFRLGAEHRVYPAGRFEPSIARRQRP